jgi:catechol 2,3-dioxygenase-like lactoylglutathione lyase family enzyme
MSEKTINVLKAHLAVNVRNVEDSIGFYKKMFGIEPSKVRPGYAKFDVQNPPLNFTLNQVPFGEKGALSHLGLQVASTDDVLQMRDAWIERGLAARDEMQTDCCYALQDKAWVNDPDGNAWEVFTVIEDDLHADATEGAAVCCAPVKSDAADQRDACACESEAPAAGEAACCDTQAEKFGISEKAGEAAATCC